MLWVEFWERAFVIVTKFSNIYVALGADFAVIESWRMHLYEWSHYEFSAGLLWAWMKVDMLDPVYSPL